MPRISTFNTILAMAAGAATAATVVEYNRQKRVAMTRLGRDSQLVETDLGVAEVATIGDGPAVLFIHGALAGYEQGLLVGRPLAEAGYRLIVPSRPGYLRTPVIDDMSFAGQADFLVALLDALKIKQTIVLGMSAGGPYAINLAARHPDRVQALLLYCAISKQAFVNPDEETTESWMFGNLMQSDFLTWAGVQSMIKTLPLMALSEPDGWRARVMASPKRRAMYDRLLWALFPSSVRLAGALNDKALVERATDLPLKKVQTPTLVIHGTEDELVPFAHGENSAKKIAGARFLPIPGAAHGFMISHDELVWPETLAFLQRPSTAAKKPSARKPVAKKSAPAPVTKPAPRRTTRTPEAPARSRATSTTTTRRRRPAASG